MQIITSFYNLLWGDLITISLPDGSSIGLSLLVMLLIPSGIYFTIRTKFLPIRSLRSMNPKNGLFKRPLLRIRSYNTVCATM